MNSKKVGKDETGRTGETLPSIAVRVLLNVLFDTGVVV